MKAKVTLFKMRVKEASKILSVNDIYSWDTLEPCVFADSDVTMLPNGADMEDVGFSEIRVVNISVN